MATPAQILANRENSQSSTGPKTETGKAAVARNSVSHGLSSGRFALLPQEDPSEYHSLLNDLTDEHGPETPTEVFLIEELARAQWKLRRVHVLESEILGGSDSGSSWSGLARRFAEDCSADQVLLKLNRYEQTARRAWHNALDKLMAVRQHSQAAAYRESRIHAKQMEAAVSEILAAPLPIGEPPAAAKPQVQNYEAKPMPKHLQRELDAHRRRDPLFDPVQDRSQMSKELRKYFDNSR